MYTFPHPFLGYFFTLSEIWFVLCCLVVKCWHLGALPGLVESQYCFSYAASALLRSSSAEPEPISQFANLRSTESPFLQQIRIGTERTQLLKRVLHDSKLVWLWKLWSGTGCCLFCQRNEVTRVFQKNGHDEMRTHNVRPRQGTVGTSGTPWENFWPRWQNTFHGPRFRWCLLGPPPISVWLMGLVSMWSKERCLELIRY